MTAQNGKSPGAKPDADSDADSVHLATPVPTQSSTARYAPWSAKTDAEMLHTLSVEFETSVYNCDWCGHGEDMSTFDCASMLRDYMTLRAVEAASDQHGSQHDSAASRIEQLEALLQQAREALSTSKNWWCRELHNSHVRPKAQAAIVAIDALEPVEPVKGEQ